MRGHDGVDATYSYGSFDSYNYSSFSWSDHAARYDAPDYWSSKMDQEACMFVHSCCSVSNTNVLDGNAMYYYLYNDVAKISI
jgi:hypothetical protein